MYENTSVKIYPTSDELSTVSGIVNCSQAGCSATFQSTSNLHMHLIKHHKVPHNGLAKKQETEYFCPIATCAYYKDSKKHFTKLKYLKQHFLKVHAQKIFACEKCDKKFSTEAFKISHLKNCGKLFECTCGSSYKSYEAILTHCKRKGKGHTYVRNENNSAENKKTNIFESKEKNNKKNARLLYPKVSCDVSFPIHYIAAIALSELSTPCNLSKVADVGIQTEINDMSIKKDLKSNIMFCKYDKKRKSSQQTQTMGKFKKLKISAQTQTNSLYLKPKAKNMKSVQRKRKSSMETQTRDIFKVENNPESKIQNFKQKDNKEIAINQPRIFSKSKENKMFFIKEEKMKVQPKENSGNEKAKKWGWDNQFFYQKDTAITEVTETSHVKNDLFNLNSELNLCSKELDLNEYETISSKNCKSQYLSSDQGSDSQMFDLRLCNIETQTEIDSFLSECGDDTTFTLCSTTETQTVNDLDSLLYSNMCTQTCEQLFNFNFVHIETQTPWSDLTENFDHDLDQG